MSKSTVVSLLPFPIHEEKPGIIPAYYDIERSDGKNPVVLVVDDGTRFLYLDHERGSADIPVFSAVIAKSIVEDFFRAQICFRPQSRPEASPGLFWVEGAHSAEGIKRNFPTELEKARKEQIAWFQELVKIADDDWARYKLHVSVSDRQREAAKFLNLKRDWLFDTRPDEMTRCKFCNSFIPGIAVVCPACRQILDVEKYNTLMGSQASK